MLVTGIFSSVWWASKIDTTVSHLATKIGEVATRSPAPMAETDPRKPPGGEPAIAALVAERLGSREAKFDGLRPVHGKTSFVVGSFKVDSPVSMTDGVASESPTTLVFRAEVAGPDPKSVSVGQHDAALLEPRLQAMMGDKPFGATRVRSSIDVLTPKEAVVKMVFESADGCKTFRGRAFTGGVPQMTFFVATTP